MHTRKHKTVGGIYALKRRDGLDLALSQGERRRISLLRGWWKRQEKGPELWLSPSLKNEGRQEACGGNKKQDRGREMLLQEEGYDGESKRCDCGQM